MKRRLLSSLACLIFPLSTQATWFEDTPLARTYQALLNNQPQLAWQELHLALNQQDIDRQYWLPVKQEILNQSQCGQQLIANSSPLPADLSVSFVRRSGLSSQGFQIKISAESTQNDLTIELIDPSAKRLLNGELTQQSDYQEIETEELLIEPVSGLYQLKLGNTLYPLLVAMPENQSWIRLDNSMQQIHLTLPVTESSCTKPTATWQWFDSQYLMLGMRKPISSLVAPVPRSTQIPDGAKHLSATVSVFEYQQGLKIEYIQRIAIPFAP
ncbi:DUF2861 family protein [Vibrio coralliilyticus]